MVFPRWIIGVVFAVLASFISNVGLNLQKLNHVRNDTQSKHWRRQSLLKEGLASDTVTVSGPSPSPLPSSASPLLINDRAIPIYSEHVQQPPTLPLSPHSPLSYHKQPLWRIGLLLVGLGSIADFVALIFAGTTVVAPLASLTLVSNTLLAPLLLGESVTRHDILATIAIVCGSSLSVACADHKDRNYSLIELFDLFLKLRFILYSIVVGVIVAVFYSLLKRFQRIHDTSDYPTQYLRVRRWHRFSYAALSGILGGQSVLFAKCCGQMLTAALRDNGSSDLFLVHPTSYLIIALLCCTVTLQLHFLNEGLRRFTSLFVVPTFQAFWIFTSVLTGMIFFGEWRGVFDASSSGIFFPLGIMLTIGGVYQLSQRGGLINEEDFDRLIEYERSINSSTVNAIDASRNRSQSVDDLNIQSIPSMSSSSFFLLPKIKTHPNQYSNHARQYEHFSAPPKTEESNSLSSSMPSDSLMAQLDQPSDKLPYHGSQRGADTKDGASLDGSTH